MVNAADRKSKRRLLKIQVYGILALFTLAGFVAGMMVKSLIAPVESRTIIVIEVTECSPKIEQRPSLAEVVNNVGGCSNK